jgi:hypothetical protein
MESRTVQTAAQVDLCYLITFPGATMPRKSVDALSIVPRLPADRVAPPPGLSRKERELWRRIVDSKPAEWFDSGSAPLLREYVRSVAVCDALAGMVAGAMKGPAADLKAALDLRDKEARRLASLATKLRLTQQSRYTPLSASTANRKASGARPWSDDATR